MEPATFWTTMLAWLCCSAMWWLMTTFSGWWVVLPAILLVSLSFTVAVIKDLTDLDPSTEPKGL